MKKPKRRKTTVVRTGLPAATWRMLNSGFSGFGEDETLNLKKMLDLHEHLTRVTSVSIKPSKELTEATKIIEKHLFILIKSIKRVTK